jgi:tape measure domain-containing protein
MTEEEILLRLRLLGEAQTIAGLDATSAATGRLAKTTDVAGAAMLRTSRRGFLMNQAIFTTRRLLYGLSLGLLASGVATLKWGFDFNETMKTATISLLPMLGNAQAVNRELDVLFQQAKFSPFTFGDTTLAFRNMFLAMSQLGISADTVNTTMQSIIDTLAAGGRSTPASLNRVSYALQHMAYLGHLTGQTVNQLGRDGIPVAAILAKEFGLTGEQIHNVGKLGIPTLAFLQAFNKYAQENPVISGAARRQAMGSFQGLFAQFKDSMSQIMGAVEKGFFNRSVGLLQRITGFFNRFSDSVKGATSATQVIGLMFPQLLPLWRQVAADVHLLFTEFTAIFGTILHNRAVWAIVYAGLLALHGILLLIKPLADTMKYWLYIVIPLWVTYRAVVIAASIATGVQAFEEIILTRATKSLTFFQFLLAVATGRYMIMARLATAATWLYTAAIYAGYAAQYALGILSIWLRTQLAILFTVIELNPIMLLVTAAVLLVAGLVLLYYKWKWFHDLVNRTWNWIVNHKRDIAMAIEIAFAPLFTVVKVLEHIGDLWRGLRGAFHFLFGGGGHPNAPGRNFQNNAGQFSNNLGGDVFANNLGNFPKMAGGGSVFTPGLAWVGERGPELLRLPRGAEVSPVKSPFNNREAWMGNESRTLNLRVNMHVNRRVLGEIIAEEIALQGARA